MIFSAQSLLSDDQTVNANAASTNVLDLGAPGTPYGGAAALTQDAGQGCAVEFLCQLTATPTGTSPTLTAALQTSPDGTTWTTVESYQFSGAAQGDRWPFRFLPEGVDQRYLRVNYTVGGTSPVFVVTAGPTLGVQTNA